MKCTDCKGDASPSVLLVLSLPRGALLGAFMLISDKQGHELGPFYIFVFCTLCTPFCEVLVQLLTLAQGAKLASFGPHVRPAV